LVFADFVFQDQSRPLRKCDPVLQKLLHFLRAGFGVLISDTAARNFACEPAQFERQLQSLFASHGTIFFNLRVQRRLRRHEKMLARIKVERIIFASTLTIFVECTCGSAAGTAAATTYCFTITGVPSSAFS